MPLRIAPSKDRKLARTFRKVESRTYSRGQRIFLRGDAARRVFLVRSGHVRLTLPEPDEARERTVALVGPLEIFGEEAFVPDARRSYGAWAGERCELAPADGDRIHHIIRSSRRSYGMFVRSGQADLLAMRRRLTGFATASTAARLADLLLELADRFGEEPTGDEIRIPHWLTHQELADLVGAHRSTVTTTLNDWIYQGILESSTRSLVVTDPPGLRSLASGIHHAFPRAER